MKAAEKAKLLLDLFRYANTEGVVYDSKEANEAAKRCALICVDEIIKSNNEELYIPNHVDIEHTSDSNWVYEEFMKYWQEVKKEIEKL